MQQAQGFGILNKTNRYGENNMKEQQMEAHIKAERSIIKTYRKTIWHPFVEAIKEYGLIEDGDKIAVCISGGKDSMLLAKCMQELHAHGKQNFELKFLAMDPGYDKANRKKIEENATKLQVPLTIVESNIFDVVDHQTNGSPCYLCARMRRGNLYAFARDLGCNKIALGHHFDDVIETTLMSMLYNGQFKTMLPKLNSKNFAGMKLIRPLYKVKEKDILKWVNYNELQFINCACKLTQACELEGGESASKRKEMKRLVQSLQEKNPIFANNLFQSLYEVDTDTIISYKKDGKTYSVMEDV